MKKKTKKSWAIVFIVVAILLVVRLLMPVVAKNIINNKLAQLKNYKGHIEDVDLLLIAGEYSIEGLVITKIDSVLDIPFVKVDDIEAKLQWNHLFEGDLVGQLTLDKPVINFATGADGEAVQRGKGENWVKTVKGLIPIRINQFEIKNGEIHYQDFSTDPQIDVYLHQLDLQMSNITNIDSNHKALPAHLSLNATTIGGGNVAADGGMNLLKQLPDIDINLSIEDVDMTSLNDFLRAYTNTDANQGTFNLYTEIAMDGGQIEGYVKPVVRNLDMVEWKKEDEPFLDKVWEGIVGGVAEIFENQDEDQLATRVPLKGNVKDVETGLWPTVWSIFKNAFIDAFSRSVGGTIEFEDA